ncbi:MAG: hypothetical protein J6V90_03295 [Treponema sp.]|nr:hypothetical protein [Treponema sp.]
MKKFIFKMMILVMLVFLLPVAIFLLICPQYTHEYNASFLDKMKRLESLQSPKIILVSNSNLAFGIQSDIIEKKVGMPVVNLGLHGGLGNAFHERMPLFNLNKGDIVAIAHLDYHDDDKILDPELALLTLENYFKYWKIFRPKDYPDILGVFLKYAYKCALRFFARADKEPSSPTCYARSAFNEYGDNVFPRDIEAGESEPSLRHPKVDAKSLRRINKFYDYCKSRGADLVIAGAPILSGLAGFDEQEYVDFQKDIERFAACPVISDFRNYVFDKKYFYAGALHLTNVGAVLRSEQLAKDLNAYLGR